MTYTPTPLPPSKRVRRVAHRLGVVIAIPMTVAAAFFSAFAVYTWVIGFSPATRFSDIPYYSYPRPMLQGDTIIFKDGSTQSLADALQAENSSRASHHRVSLNDQAGFAVFFTIGAALAYLLIRSIGWVIAGAFKE